jgi:hypothetical protein
MKSNSRVLLLTITFIGVGVLISMIVFRPSSPVESEKLVMPASSKAIDTHSEFIRELDADQTTDLKTATFAVG